MSQGSEGFWSRLFDCIVDLLVGFNHRRIFRHQLARYLVVIFARVVSHVTLLPPPMCTTDTVGVIADLRKHPPNLLRLISPPPLFDTLCHAHVLERVGRTELHDNPLEC